MGSWAQGRKEQVPANGKQGKPNDTLQQRHTHTRARSGRDPSPSPTHDSRGGGGRGGTPSGQHCLPADRCSVREVHVFVGASPILPIAPYTPLIVIAIQFLHCRQHGKAREVHLGPEIKAAGFVRVCQQLCAVLVSMRGVHTAAQIKVEVLCVPVLVGEIWKRFLQDEVPAETCPHWPTNHQQNWRDLIENTPQEEDQGDRHLSIKVWHHVRQAAHVLLVPVRVSFAIVANLAEGR